MKRFEDLLNDYGLIIDFIDPKARGWQEKLYNYLKTEKEVDALTRTMSVLRYALLLKIVDSTRFLNKINASKKYRKVAPLMERDVCVDVKRDKKDSWEADVIRIENNASVNQYLVEKLKRDPEAFGFTKKELKLKEIFDANYNVNKEARNIAVLFEEMMQDGEIKKHLQIFAEKMGESLKNEEDDPEWYVNICKDNKRFKAERNFYNPTKNESIIYR